MVVGSSARKSLGSRLMLKAAAPSAVNLASSVSDGTWWACRGVGCSSAIEASRPNSRNRGMKGLEKERGTGEGALGEVKGRIRKGRIAQTSLVWQGMKMKEEKGSIL